MECRERRVVFKQHNSRLCLVCGLRNAIGLKARFYGLDDGTLVATFTARDEHQSYPGRMHGGMAATILDETIGRALMTPEAPLWGVTVDFSMKLRQPVPLGVPLRAVGRIDSETARSFKGSGFLLLADNSVAVEGWGSYLKMPLDKIADFDHEGEEWRILEEKDDPVSFSLPPLAEKRW